MGNKETLKEAGYKYVRRLTTGELILRNTEGELEVWVCNKHHASYGLKWRGTHLEFARSWAGEA